MLLICFSYISKCWIKENFLVRGMSEIITGYSVPETELQSTPDLPKIAKISLLRSLLIKIPQQRRVYPKKSPTANSFFLEIYQRQSIHTVVKELSDKNSAAGGFDKRALRSLWIFIGRGQVMIR